MRQAEESLQICQGLAACLTARREPGKVKHPLNQLINQRVYQIVAGYEDSNDSNYLRHDSIFKMACDSGADSGRRIMRESTHYKPIGESDNSERNQRDNEILFG